MNQRFVLGVDLDGVCGDYIAALHTFCIAQGIPVPANPDPAAWNLVDAGWFATRDDYDEAHRAAVHQGIFAWMPEIPGASDALWKLSDLEIRLRVVTHRLDHNNHAVVVSDTVRWLQTPRPDGRPRVPYRDLAFLGTKHALDSNLHVDDAPHVIEAMKEAGMDVIIFDQPYNRHLDGIRAHGWEEVVDIVTRFRNDA